jgi:hypothetical protein
VKRIENLLSGVVVPSTKLSKEFELYYDNAAKCFRFGEKGVKK